MKTAGLPTTWSPEPKLHPAPANKLELPPQPEEAWKTTSDSLGQTEAPFQCFPGVTEWNGVLAGRPGASPLGVYTSLEELSFDCACLLTKGNHGSPFPSLQLPQEA